LVEWGGVVWGVVGGGCFGVGVGWVFCWIFQRGKEPGKESNDVIQ